jgi:hypothetical protein
MLVDDEEIEDMFLQEEKISDECRLVFNPGFRPRYTKQELQRITEAASPAFCHNMVSAGGTSIESPVNEMAWATHSTNDTFRFAAACSPRVVDNGTMLVFSGDRKVVNGVKSEEEVYRALYNHLMTLSRLTGLPMNSRDPSVSC